MTTSTPYVVAIGHPADLKNVYLVDAPTPQGALERASAHLATLPTPTRITDPVLTPVNPHSWILTGLHRIGSAPAALRLHGLVTIAEHADITVDGLHDVYSENVYDLEAGKTLLDQHYTDGLDVAHRLRHALPGPTAATEPATPEREQPAPVVIPSDKYPHLATAACPACGWSATGFYAPENVRRDADVHAATCTGEPYGTERQRAFTASLLSRATL